MQNWTRLNWLYTPKGHQQDHHHYVYLQFFFVAFNLIDLRILHKAPQINRLSFYECSNLSIDKFKRRKFMRFSFLSILVVYFQKVTIRKNSIHVLRHCIDLNKNYNCQLMKIITKLHLHMLSIICLVRKVLVTNILWS